MTLVLGEEVAAAFARDGVVCVRSVLDPAEVAVAAAAIDAVLARPGRRRVLSLRYLSADVRHAPRRWRTSPPFDGLDGRLPAGGPMDHPLFPVVWPA
jgi:hypothetical protein